MSDKHGPITGPYFVRGTLIEAPSTTVAAMSKSMMRVMKPEVVDSTAALLASSYEALELLVAIYISSDIPIPVLEKVGQFLHKHAPYWERRLTVK